MSKHEAIRKARSGALLLALAVLSILGGVIALITASAGLSEASAEEPRAAVLQPQVTLTPRPQPVAIPTAMGGPVVEARTEPAGEREQSTSRDDEREETAPVRTGGARTRYIHIVATATPATMQGKLDRCMGAIQINWSSHSPEIAQHDYCGGAWYAGVRPGEIIKVSGGSLAGTYRVTDNHRYVRKGAPASSIDGLGDVVLQTCVGNRLSLVGLDRI